MKKQKKLSMKEIKTLMTKEDIVRALESRNHDFRVPFKKTVWGYAIIRATTLKEAKNKFQNGDIDDECDNDSEYEWEEMEEDMYSN